MAKRKRAQKPQQKKLTQNNFPLSIYVPISWSNKQFNFEIDDENKKKRKHKHMHTFRSDTKDFHVSLKPLTEEYL